LSRILTSLFWGPEYTSFGLEKRSDSLLALNRLQQVPIRVLTSH